MARTPNIEKLKRLGHVTKLVEALHDPHDESVRRAAAQALGEIGGQEVMPALVEAMASDVCPVAGPAAESLAGLDAAGGRVPVEELVAALRSSRRWHRRGEQACSCQWLSNLFWQTTQVMRRRAGSNHVPLMVGLLGEDDVHLRECAAVVLQAIGDPKAVRPLLAQLAREPYDQVPHRVIFDAIASFRDPATVDVLLRWLGGTPPLNDHGSYLGFTGEVAALVRFGPPDLDLRLAALIADRKCPRQRQVLQETVAEQLGNPEAARAAADRAEQAARRAPLDRALAAGARGIGMLVDFLDAEDAAFREDARRGLSAVDDPGMYDVLIRLLRHGDAGNRQFAVAELGRRRDRRAVFPLIDLHRRGGPLGQAAAQSLARLGVADVADFLLAALDAPDTRTRALARLGAERRATGLLRRFVADPRLGYHLRALAQARLADLGEGDPVPEPLTDADPAAGDLRQRSVEILRSTLRELRIGRSLGPTPYRIGPWEEDRRQAMELPAGAEPPPVPGGELPDPYHIIVGSGSGHLFMESYTDYDSGNNLPWQRWRTLGYHWDVRKAMLGIYFVAAVNEHGLVEFGVGAGGRYPADPDGWRAVVADINRLAPDKRIRLWTPWSTRT